MTTIASDGKIIAADDQATNNFVFTCPNSKIHFIRGSWIGFCGDVASVEKMREWMEAGAHGDKRPVCHGKDDWGALELTAAGELFLWEGDGRRFPVSKPFAIGSGADFAMGAMLVGATAVAAVEAAIALDPYSGGKISTGKAGVPPRAPKKRRTPRKKSKRA